MGILFIILFIIIMARVSTAMSLQAQGDAKAELIKAVAKWCPPHAWYFDEKKDAEGNIISSRTVCRHCGPLSKQEPHQKMDY
jgi:hypothetical protein